LDPAIAIAALTHWDERQCSETDLVPTWQICVLEQEVFLLFLLCPFRRRVARRLLYDYDDLFLCIRHRVEEWEVQRLPFSHFLFLLIPGSCGVKE